MYATPVVLATLSEALKNFFVQLFFTPLFFPVPLCDLVHLQRTEETERRTAFTGRTYVLKGSRKI